VNAHLHTVDVLPTILQAAGMAAPARVEGRSGLDPGFSSRPRVELWSSTYVPAFRKRTYSLPEVRRRSVRAHARQLALFGTGPFRGPRWRPLG
jgi:arylsulfatase A-like enzyme